MPESNKQRKKDLVGKEAYMPIVERASKGDGPNMMEQPPAPGDAPLAMMGDASFMSKHSQSRMMSSGKPVAMQLMGKDGKAKSSMEGKY
jgi:hypothetical protein